MAMLTVVFSFLVLMVISCILAWLPLYAVAALVDVLLKDR